MSTMTQWLSFVIVPSWWAKMGARPICGGVLLWRPAMPIPFQIAPSVNNPVESYAVVENVCYCKCLVSN